MNISTGGKGTVRRKIVRKPKPSTAQDDKKLQGALKKLSVQPITGVEEVNMFREDGNVLHFTAPKGEWHSLNSCDSSPRIPGNFILFRRIGMTPHVRYVLEKTINLVR